MMANIQNVKMNARDGTTAAVTGEMIVETIVAVNVVMTVAGNAGMIVVVIVVNGNGEEEMINRPRAQVKIINECQ